MLGLKAGNLFSPGRGNYLEILRDPGGSHFIEKYKNSRKKSIYGYVRFDIRELILP